MMIWPLFYMNIRKSCFRITLKKCSCQKVKKKLSVFPY